MTRGIISTFTKLALIAGVALAVGPGADAKVSSQLSLTPIQKRPGATSSHIGWIRHEAPLPVRNAFLAGMTSKFQKQKSGAVAPPFVSTEHLSYYRQGQGYGQRLRNGSMTIADPSDRGYVQSVLQNGGTSVKLTNLRLGPRNASERGQFRRGTSEGNGYMDSSPVNPNVRRPTRTSSTGSPIGQSDGSSIETRRPGGIQGAARIIGPDGRPIGDTADPGNGRRGSPSPGTGRRPTGGGTDTASAPIGSSNPGNVPGAPDRGGGFTPNPAPVNNGGNNGDGNNNTASRSDDDDGDDLEGFNRVLAMGQCAEDLLYGGAAIGQAKAGWGEASGFLGSAMPLLQGVGGGLQGINGINNCAGGLTGNYLYDPNGTFGMVTRTASLANRVVHGLSAFKNAWGLGQDKNPATAAGGQGAVTIPPGMVPVRLPDGRIAYVPQETTPSQQVRMPNGQVVNIPGGGAPQQVRLPNGQVVSTGGGNVTTQSAQDVSDGVVWLCIYDDNRCIWMKALVSETGPGGAPVVGPASAGSQVVTGPDGAPGAPVIPEVPVVPAPNPQLAAQRADFMNSCMNSYPGQGAVPWWWAEYVCKSGAANFNGDDGAAAGAAHAAASRQNLGTFAEGCLEAYQSAGGNTNDEAAMTAMFAKCYGSSNGALPAWVGAQNQEMARELGRAAMGGLQPKPAPAPVVSGPPAEPTADPPRDVKGTTGEKWDRLPDEFNATPPVFATVPKTAEEVGAANEKVNEYNRAVDSWNADHPDDQRPKMQEFVAPLPAPAPAPAAPPGGDNPLPADDPPEPPAKQDDATGGTRVEAPPAAPLKDRSGREAASPEGDVGEPGV